ncbi:unnamed protein product [Clonostachys rhizophaga]|uniref:Aminotransferase class I/classII large domain-containing protein n=1 Tax=Clonostachys rhizophaga TaxID=160324 RepID=A0A9N9VQD2_9HYPO|nr:unnamed protein product [Clonostachys rhizophaga]
MPEFINLQLGWPTPSLFPAEDVLEGASRILQSPKKTASALIYGPDAGYVPLRENIAAWLTESYKPSGGIINADRICVSNGASANLGNILSKFTEPGYTRRIWMIEPSYFLACPIFTDSGFAGCLRGVPEDEEGLDIEFLRASIKRVETELDHPTAPKFKTGARYKKIYKHIIYAVPTFSNPSGKTMSLRRRQDLVRLAREFDCLVITDDVYDVLRWPKDAKDPLSSYLGAIPPRIVDVDRTLDGGPSQPWGNAVSNGSFSKIIAPGIRTGWAEATPAFALSLSELGATRSGGCPTQIAGTFVAEMIGTGRLQSHISDVLIPTYSARYHTMFRAIDEYLIPLGFKVSIGKLYEETNAVVNGHGTAVPAAGGYFTYLTVPADLPVDTGKLAALAMEKYNLKFAFGAMMAVEGDEGSLQRSVSGYGNGIRLCWAWHPEDEILEGIQRLASLVKEIQQ